MAKKIPQFPPFPPQELNGRPLKRKHNIKITSLLKSKIIDTYYGQ